MSKYGFLKERTAAFQRIYERELWGKGKGSGTGSSPAYCAKYLEYLASILSGYTSVLDMGCGDWQLYECFDWDSVDYTGTDIYEPNILKHYSTDVECAKALIPTPFLPGNRRWIWADIVVPAELNNVYNGQELLLLKDVAQHWTDNEIEQWLETVMQFPFKTLLVTNHWKHFRSPENNSKPRDLNNPYRYAPVDFRKYGFKDVLYYPGGRFKQICRFDKM